MRLVIFLVCVLVSHARADDKANLAAARQALEAQFRVFADESPPPETADAFMVAPGHFGQGSMSTWMFGPPYISGVKIKNAAAGWVGQGNGSWGWIAADLAVEQRPYSPSDGAPAAEEVHRYHLLQVYVRDAGVVKIKATQLTDTMPDAKLPRSKPGKPPEVKPGSLLANLIAPGKAKLLANSQVAVLGSSTGETALGSAAARKLLAGWGKLELALVGSTPTKELTAGDLGVAFAEVDLVVAKVPRRLRAMVVAKRSGTTWEVAALAFGPDTTFGDPEIR